MSVKIGLNIGGRHFDVDVEEEFSLFLKQEMAKDFNINGNNDLKVLLQSYVRKNHELFTQEQKMKEIIKKCDDLG
ncbi:hypothetical protein [Candidatus Sulfurimonas baltica]|uniref:Uncharacterized protein n=1 Tax=Candidatus Sulfurimonas baltica TaxID=2740404 RepID=A0A7S7RMK2_9BACT|nr:hypothetical protein [Candidatus Sulfurimonas baltica]QOY51508.1 hypothetical protein HUE88_10335 [Candidatus Sulfurimonas baltica]